MSKHIVLQLLFRITNILLNLSVGISIINYLGPNAQGQLAFAINTVGMLTFLTTLGIGPHYSKVVSNANCMNDINEIKSILLFLRAIGCFFLSIIVAIFISFFSKESLANLIAIIILARFTFALNIYHDIFEGKGLMDKSAIINIVVAILVAIFRCACIFYDLGLHYVAFSYVLEQILTLLISRRYLSEYRYLPIRIDVHKSKLVFLKVFPLCMSSIVISVFTQIDIFLIGIIRGETEVGIYSSALKVVTPLYFFGSLVMSVYFNRLNRLYISNEKDFHNKISILSGVLILSSIIISILIYIFGDELYKFLFDVKFHSGVDIFKWLIFVLPFVYLGPVTGKYLIITGDYKTEFNKTCVACLINIVLGVLLIPTWGGEGAAIGTVISYFFANYGFLFLNKKNRKLLNDINRLGVIRQ